MNKTRLYTLLTYAGTLPFIACAILLFVNVQGLPLLGSLTDIAAAYALVIVSFMAGTHWGSYLVSQEASPFNLFVLQRDCLSCLAGIFKRWNLSYPVGINRRFYFSVVG